MRRDGATRRRHHDGRRLDHDGGEQRFEHLVDGEGVGAQVEVDESGMRVPRGRGRVVAVGDEDARAVPLGDSVDGAYRIRSLGSGSGLLTAKIKDVALFGESESPEWEQTAEGLVIRTDKRAVVKVSLEPETPGPRCDFF